MSHSNRDHARVVSHDTQARTLRHNVARRGGRLGSHAALFFTLFTLALAALGAWGFGAAANAARGGRDVQEAAAPYLDPTFGSGGKVLVSVYTNNTLTGLAVQPDGKIVLAGDSFSATHDDDFTLVRLNTDGSLDATFGSGGKVAADVYGRETPYAMALQPDGKILVAGAIPINVCFCNAAAVVRFNPDGSLDRTFGSNGEVNYILPAPTLTSSDFTPKAIAVQPDGKIVVAGEAFRGVYGIGIMRLNPDGSLDRTFGGTGRFSVEFGAGTHVTNAVALQPDGHVVVVGRVFNPIRYEDFLVVRLNPDGSVDTGFGPGANLVGPAIGPAGSCQINFGEQVPLVGNKDSCFGVAVRADGTLLAVGNSYNFFSSDFALARLGPGGLLDPSFSGDGMALTSFSDATARRPGSAFAAFPMPGGKTLVVGASGSDTVAALYRQDGELDPTFGSGGKVIAEAASLMTSRAALTPDGRLVVAGDGFASGSSAFAVTRYNITGTTPTPTPTPTPAPNVVQFASAAYAVEEGMTAVPVGVTLTRRDQQTVTVEYSTADGTAGQKGDYTFAAGRLTFAPGETSKGFDVLVGEDSRAEGDESLSVVLRNPSGATLGARPAATLTIRDDPVEPTENVIDDPETFVAQHYHDFLGREPDAPGLAFWTQRITDCGADARCVQEMRVNVSAAFFLSIEFQQTGYMVDRLYETCLGVRPNYEQFLGDTRQVGRGVVVGVGDWEQRLEQNKQAFAEEFVRRDAFVRRYPDTMTAEQFVDEMYGYAGVAPSAAERQEAVTAYGVGNAQGRAAAVRKVIDSHGVFNRYYNGAFVLIQYHGYLRRDPDDPPDTNWNGYNFWLDKLNRASIPGEDVSDDSVALGRVRRAEMVRAFIESTEYRGRFQ
jgi:uncharacterized delta-60 repeat protein